MRLVRFGGAMSLDGYIAGPSGEYDWILHDPDIDFGEMQAQFDTFLSNEVPAIQAFDPGSLIIITFDEGTSNKGPSNSKQFAGGGNIVFLAIGPGVSANHTDSTPSNHYGLLKTLEACYGLGALSGASAGYDAATPISGICQ